ncbi:MAG: hypothetical protein LUD83_05050, partial [Clostridiales bacterium]|nr:hypothetical protein [Clostridiales bacterium]
LTSRKNVISCSLPEKCAKCNHSRKINYISAATIVMEGNLDKRAEKQVDFLPKLRYNHLITVQSRGRRGSYAD